MESQLKQCLICLDDAEKKLLELQESLSNDFIFATRIAEALSFIAQARRALADAEPL